MVHSNVIFSKIVGLLADVLNTKLDNNKLFSMYAILHAIWTPSPLFACNTQWKCIGELTPPPSP